MTASAPARKKTTGEPGNGGQFGHRVRGGVDDVRLESAAEQNLPPLFVCQSGCNLWNTSIETFATSHAKANGHEVIRVR